jgi:hypothetical protein
MFLSPIDTLSRSGGAGLSVYLLGQYAPTVGEATKG